MNCETNLLGQLHWNGVRWTRESKQLSNSSANHDYLQCLIARFLMNAQRRTWKKKIVKVFWRKNNAGNWIFTFFLAFSYASINLGRRKLSKLKMWQNKGKGKSSTQTVFFPLEDAKIELNYESFATPRVRLEDEGELRSGRKFSWSFVDHRLSCVITKGIKAWSESRVLQQTFQTNKLFIVNVGTMM